MSSHATPVSGEGRLWAISFLVSLLLNALLFGVLAKISSRDAARQARTLAEARPVERWVAAVIPERGMPVPSAAKPAPFARTSAEQESERPTAARFIGERNTRATSDRASEASAPPIPSQNGVEDARPLETTENRYREGDLTGGNGASPPESHSPTEVAAARSTSESSPPSSETKDSRGPESASPRPSSPPTPLAQGPKPVDVQVEATPSKPEEDSPKQTPPRETVETKPAPTVPAEPKLSESAESADQKKTRMRGSISRQDTGALDVEDSPSGRYQANVIRAIEREWQRNCVKYKALITPGFLTVRFVVEPTGKVRSVDFLEAADSSDLQKGFTLDSIREAKIPAMPAELKKQRRGEPLELTYNFYF